MTRAPWPKVRLGEVLRKADDPASVSADQEYPNFGIYSFGRGLFRKPPISGTTTSARTVFRARRGQFIYSRLFAFEGAYGVVPDDFDGWYVSNEYPMFDADPGRLLPTYLAAYFRLPSTWEEVARRAVGMGDRRRRVQPDQFLEHSIPLPPLPEQRRIVAKLDQLAAKVDEARRLRATAANEVRRLASNMAHRADLPDSRKVEIGWRRLPLSEILQPVKDRHRVEADRTYDNLGIYSFGRGLFRKQPIEGTLTSAPFLHRVKKGQFIYSRLFAFEGAYGMVTEEFDGFFVSPEYPTFECQPDRVRVEFMWAHFSAPHVWREVAAGSKGLGDRRQRVQPEQILTHELWVPPIGWQDRLAEVLSRSARAHGQQSRISAELDALMPAILDRAFKGEL